MKKLISITLAIVCISTIAYCNFDTTLQQYSIMVSKIATASNAEVAVLHNNFDQYLGNMTTGEIESQLYEVVNKLEGTTTENEEEMTKLFDVFTYLEKAYSEKSSK